MSRLVSVSGLALLAVVTAACAVKVSGTPAAVPTSDKTFADPDRITAEDALGDLKEWNPCSVVDPDAMPTSWTARVATPAAFENCVMDVSTDDNKDGLVRVGYLYRSTHDLDEHKDGERPGGITVVPVDDDDLSCTRDIVFADGIALVVRAWPDDPADKGAMCEISDTVVDNTLEAVMAGKADTLPLPDNSLGEVDPCDLVTAEMAAAVPGITAEVEAERQVSRHSCWWAADESTMLNIEFEIGTLPEGDSGETVHGRYTAVTEYVDDEATSLCEVSGEHVPFEFADESGLMERVGIYVYLKPGQVKTACTAGKQLADKLWPKLPPL